MLISFTFIFILFRSRLSRCGLHVTLVGIYKQKQKITFGFPAFVAMNTLPK